MTMESAHFRLQQTRDLSQFVAMVRITTPWLIALANAKQIWADCCPGEIRRMPKFFRTMRIVAEVASAANPKRCELAEPCFPERV
jgi:hypothetical protein